MMTAEQKALLLAAMEAAHMQTSTSNVIFLRSLMDEITRCEQETPELTLQYTAIKEILIKEFPFSTNDKPISISATEPAKINNSTDFSIKPIDSTNFAINPHQLHISQKQGGQGQPQNFDCKNGQYLPGGIDALAQKSQDKTDLVTTEFVIDIELFSNGTTTTPCKLWGFIPGYLIATPLDCNFYGEFDKTFNAELNLESELRINFIHGEVPLSAITDKAHITYVADIGSISTSMNATVNLNSIQGAVSVGIKGPNAGLNLSIDSISFCGWRYASTLSGNVGVGAQVELGGCAKFDPSLGTYQLNWILGAYAGPGVSVNGQVTLDKDTTLSDRIKQRNEIINANYPGFDSMLSDINKALKQAQEEEIKHPGTVQGLWETYWKNFKIACYKDDLKRWTGITDAAASAIEMLPHFANTEASTNPSNLVSPTNNSDNVNFAPPADPIENLTSNWQLQGATPSASETQASIYQGLINQHLGQKTEPNYNSGSTDQAQNEESLPPVSAPYYQEPEPNQAEGSYTPQVQTYEQGYQSVFEPKMPRFSENTDSKDRENIPSKLDLSTQLTNLAADFSAKTRKSIENDIYFDPKIINGQLVTLQKPNSLIQTCVFFDPQAQLPNLAIKLSIPNNGDNVDVSVSTDLLSVLYIVYDLGKLISKAKDFSKHPKKKECAAIINLIDKGLDTTAQIQTLFNLIDNSSLLDSTDKKNFRLLAIAEIKTPHSGLIPRYTSYYLSKNTAPDYAENIAYIRAVLGSKNEAELLDLSVNNPYSYRRQLDDPTSSFNITARIIKTKGNDNEVFAGYISSLVPPDSAAQKLISGSPAEQENFLNHLYADKKTEENIDTLNALITRYNSNNQKKMKQVNQKIIDDFALKNPDVFGVYLNHLITAELLNDKLNALQKDNDSPAILTICNTLISSIKSKPGSVELIYQLTLLSAEASYDLNDPLLAIRKLDVLMEKKGVKQDSEKYNTATERRNVILAEVANANAMNKDFDTAVAQIKKIASSLTSSTPEPSDNKKNTQIYVDNVKALLNNAIIDYEKSGNLAKASTCCKHYISIATTSEELIKYALIDATLNLNQGNRDNHQDANNTLANIARTYKNNPEIMISILELQIANAHAIDDFALRHPDVFGECLNHLITTEFLTDKLNELKKDNNYPAILTICNKFISPIEKKPGTDELIYQMTILSAEASYHLNDSLLAIIKLDLLIEKSDVKQDSEKYNTATERRNVILAEMANANAKNNDFDIAVAQLKKIASSPTTSTTEPSEHKKNTQIYVDNVKALLNNAIIDHEKAGNLAQASTCCKHYISIATPEELIKYSFNDARLNYIQGNHPDANNTLANLAETHKNNPIIMISILDFQIANGHAKEAMNLCRTYAKENPDALKHFENYLGVVLKQAFSHLNFAKIAELRQQVGEGPEFSETKTLCTKLNLYGQLGAGQSVEIIAGVARHFSKQIKNDEQRYAALTTCYGCETVGKSISAITQYQLFYNNITLESSIGVIGVLLDTILLLDDLSKGITGKNYDLRNNPFIAGSQQILNEGNPFYYLCEDLSSANLSLSGGASLVRWSAYGIKYCLEESDAALIQRAEYLPNDHYVSVLALTDGMGKTISQVQQTMTVVKGTAYACTSASTLPVLGPFASNIAASIALLASSPYTVPVAIVASLSAVGINIGYSQTDLNIRNHLLNGHIALRQGDLELANKQCEMFEKRRYDFENEKDKSLYKDLKEQIYLNDPLHSQLEHLKELADFQQWEQDLNAYIICNPNIQNAKKDLVHCQAIISRNNLQKNNDNTAAFNPLYISTSIHIAVNVLQFTINSINTHHTRAMQRKNHSRSLPDWGYNQSINTESMQKKLIPIAHSTTDATFFHDKPKPVISALTQKQDNKTTRSSFAKQPDEESKNSQHMIGASRKQQNTLFAHQSTQSSVFSIKKTSPAFF